MGIPVKVLTASQPVEVMLALAPALAGECAIFVSKPTDDARAQLPVAADLPGNLPTEVADHIALIVETSGSTGVPKLVSLSRDALLASATAADAALGGPGQWLLALPVSYIAGLNVLLRSLVAEQQPVILNTRLPFTPEAFANAASQLRGQRRYVSLVPVQLKRLVSAARLDSQLLASLRRFDAILVGGQALDEATAKAAAELGLRVVRSYGSAETAGGCCYDGQPFAGVSVRIADTGQVEIAGPTLAEGVAGTDGWYRSNDLGEITDGILKITGRANRALNSGGIKVSLDAIEEAVLGIGGVVEAAVIAVTDAEWGERAALIYVGSPEVADDMAADALSALGPAAKPVRVIRVAAIPRLSSGKPDYLRLAAEFGSVA